MAKRVKQPEPPGDPNAWMVTFSDLLMLMLTFFVLLISMSSLDSQRIKEALRPGIHSTPSPLQSSEMNYQDKGDETPNLINATTEAVEDFIDQPNEENFERVTEYMDKFFSQHGVGGEAWCERRPEGLVINIEGDATFLPGKVALSPKALPLIRDLAELMRRVGTNIASETFYAPEGRTLKEESDAWEFALARADLAAMSLIRASLPSRQLRVMGYGFAADQDLAQSNLLRLTLFTGPANSIYEPLSTENQNNGQRR